MSLVADVMAALDRSGSEAANGGGHEPVLAAETVALLDPKPGERGIDGTFGAGGHAALIGARLGPRGSMIVVDRDPDAQARFEAMRDRLGCPARFVGGEFSQVFGDLVAEGAQADCIWLDLGVSSFQIDEAERGFSYVADGPLDMRMDPSTGRPASELVNELPESALVAILRDYGEERHARRIAGAIVAARPVSTTSELAEVVRGAVPPAYRFARGNPAKKTFQALRIAVNAEIDNLLAGLPRAWNLLPVGGRLAVISFHSLEDRPVKRFFAGLARACVCPPEAPICVCGGEPEAELLSRRAVKPSDQEMNRNPRAGSARLRVARKLLTGRAGSGHAGAKESA